jgi:hypothetical protein
MIHDSEMLAALEPSQLSVATERPLPRRRLGWRILTLLTVLRVYVVVSVAIVGYAFIHAILTSQ